MNFEHKLISFRGQLGEEAEAQLNQLGADGWAVVGVFPIDDVRSTLPNITFVLRRETASRRKQTSA